jgi:hypothetical protein
MSTDYISTIFALGLVGLIPWIVIILVIGATLKWALRQDPAPQEPRRVRHLMINGKPIREPYDWGRMFLVLFIFVAIAVALSHYGAQR